MQQTLTTTHTHTYREVRNLLQKCGQVVDIYAQSGGNDKKGHFTNVADKLSNQGSGGKNKNQDVGHRGKAIVLYRYKQAARDAVKSLNNFPLAGHQTNETKRTNIHTDTHSLLPD